MMDQNSRTAFYNAEIARLDAKIAATEASRKQTEKERGLLVEFYESATGRVYE